jgi:hypothetical protein
MATPREVSPKHLSDDAASDEVALQHRRQTVSVREAGRLDSHLLKQQLWHQTCDTFSTTEGHSV